MMRFLLLFYFINATLSVCCFAGDIKSGNDVRSVLNNSSSFQELQQGPINIRSVEAFTIQNAIHFKKSEKQAKAHNPSDKSRIFILKEKMQNTTSCMKWLCKLCVPTKFCFLAFWRGLMIGTTPFVLLFMSIKIHDLLFIDRRRSGLFSPSAPIILLYIFSSLTSLGITIYMAKEAPRLHILSAFQNFSFVLALLLWIFCLATLQVAKSLAGRFKDYKYRGIISVLKMLIMDIFIAIIAYPSIFAFFHSSDAASDLNSRLAIFAMILGFSIFPILTYLFLKFKINSAKSKLLVLSMSEVLLFAISFIFLGFILSHSLSALTMVIMTITMVISLFLPLFSPWRIWKHAIVLILCIMTAFLINFDNHLIRDKTKFDHHWTNLELLEMDRALNHNQVVLVNITAIWCVLCKVNDILLDNQTFLDFVNLNKVVLMRGDISGRDSQLGHFLGVRGVYQIPFLAIFSPLNPGGRILGRLSFPEELQSEISKEIDMLKKMTMLNRGSKQIF